MLDPWAPVPASGFAHGVENGRPGRSCLLVFLAFAAMCAHAAAQVTPAITSINPTSVLAGSPSFTLTVTGSGYLANSLVRVNGSNRATTFVSTLQLTATILASDVATPGTPQITVFNQFATGGGLTSNPVTLTASALPAPILTSISPEFTTQSADRVSLTLIGANFRPGATVVVSPPLASVTNSNGHTRATDVVVLSVTVVSSGVMTALISVSPTATLSLRAVDVLNLDGTSTATTFAAPSGSSQPLRLVPSTSLGAPLSVLNMALTHPRDGTVVMQGDELNAQAVLAGTGTGTVVGQWLWDGNVVEQFTASIVGGQSKAIETRQSLPTRWLGAHTLLLRMVEPNQVVSRPVVVVVNPGNWKLEQLILPVYGAASAADDAPHLLWAPVPGAMKYQVGISTKPYLGTIDTWFDSVDNRCGVPANIWRSLPEGQLYWTVRVIDTSEAPRKPLPMRSLYREPEGSLAPPHAAPARTPAGNTLLEWKPASRTGLYYVTISSDFAATHILRRYLTSDAKLDLRAAERQLIPGTTYYWQVDALASDGRLIMSGQVQSFVAQAMPQSTLISHNPPVLLASLGSPGKLPALPAMSDPAEEIAGQTPAPDSSSNQLQPVISASFPQPVNPADVSLMLDDVDVTSLAQVTEIKISFTPPLPLTSGDHNVNLTVGSEATTWKFTVIGAATASTNVPATAVTLQPGTDAEASPTSPATMPAPAAIEASHHPAAQTPSTRTGPLEDGQIAMNSQWASGSNPPDSNVISVAEHMTYEQGPLHVEINGSGLLNSILNPEALRTSRGRVDDYVLQVGDKHRSWGANVRFGIVTPALYTDAQFVTAATPRQGVELVFKTPGGKFGGFTNTNDVALGGGAGINFKQRILGASWQAPLPEWAVLRVMWLSAVDIGAPTTVGYDSMGNPIILPNPIAPKSAGDVYGALLNLHLYTRWLWSSEYAFSRDNPNTNDPASTRQFGRAWRTGISGQPGKTSVNVAYRDVSANFGNPANPSLTEDSKPDLRGLDSAITQTTNAGTFGLTYSFLANNVRPTTSDELYLHTFDETWSKPFGVSTNVVLDARQSLTLTGPIPTSLRGLPPEQTGAQDMRDLSGNLILSRQIGKVTMSAGATRDWSRNNFFPLADTITSSLNAGANLVTGGFFQLNAQANVNWVAANGLTAGTSRNITVYVQPAFVWTRPAMQLSPLITVTQGQTVLSNGMLTSDTLTGQYGGRVTWTLPGVMKFNTLSAQGSYNQNRNTVISVDQPSTQLLVLWTATWGHKHSFLN